LERIIYCPRTLSPIAEITETARSIGEGDLSHRIEGIVSEDEVGELAAAFNAMLDKVRPLFAGTGSFLPTPPTSCVSGRHHSGMHGRRIEWGSSLKQ
jgi:hypothetical protein